MFFYNIVYCKIQINSFFFSSFLSFYLLSRGNNNSRFLTPAYLHLLLSSVSAHRFSLLLSVYLLFFPFISILSRTFLFPLSVARYTLPFFHFPRTLYHLSPSLLFADVPSLNFYFDFSSSSLFFSRHLFSLTCPPFIFVHLSPFCAPLSPFCFRILLILRLYAPSHSCCWSCRFRALLSSPHSSFYPLWLPSPLAPLNYDRLAPFISRGVPTSSSSFSSALSAFSPLPSPSLSLFLAQVSLGAARLVLSLSLYVRHSPSPSFLHTCDGHKNSLSYTERWCEAHRTPLDKFAWH